MPDLTRRLTWPDDKHSPDDWSIYYGDVAVGKIMRRQGAPHRDEQWRWSRGFYPGAHPRASLSGNAGSFEEARQDWLKAWERYLSDRTETEFEAYRAWHRQD
jgi:hypothetical protein